MMLPMEMVRLTKILSEKGICSRREGDRYIEKGWISVDGKVVRELGVKVSRDAQVKLIQREKKATILLNKPLGYVSCQPEDGHPSALDLIDRKFRKKLAPCGRLDIDSHGLMVYTQDGTLAKKLIGENSKVEKEYIVRVRGKITDYKIEELRFGMKLDGKALKQAVVRKIGSDKLLIILREGKKRQIRRMCEMVDLLVVNLVRTRIGDFRLGTIKPGEWLYVKHQNN
jgi:23S rRNA pseudouridine2604 synthase